MNENKIIITTPLAEVILYKDLGYMENILFPKKHDNMEEMIQHMDLTIDLLKKEGCFQIPILADARQVKGVSKEIRDFVSEKEKEHRVTSRLAIITGSGLSKIIGNLFFKFANIPYPMKLFSDKEKALEWLLNP